MLKQTPQQTQNEMILGEIAKLSEKIEAIEKKQAAPQEAAPRKSKRDQPRANVHYALLGVPTGRVAPQAIAVARALSTAEDVNMIPEEEAMRLIAKSVAEGRLETIQPPWRIMRYYRVALITGGYLKMVGA